MDKNLYSRLIRPPVFQNASTDVIEFGTVEKAMYTTCQLWSIVSVALSRTVEEQFHFGQMSALSRLGGPYKTLQKLNPVEFSSLVFATWKQNVAGF
jgi:hypothetical protein